MEDIMFYKNILRRLVLIAFSLLMIIIMGCDVEDGEITNVVELPMETELNLYCQDEGVYPETCVLDNPDNPFRMVIITENVYGEDDEGNQVQVVESNKFDLADGCPGAKSLFYLWATALAKGPSGENQYYTAHSLHQLYTEGGSENAKEQAKKAYRALLDNFFDSYTWYNAWWIDEDTYYPVLIRDLVAQNLIEPAEVNLLPLYDDPFLAMEELGEWGYIYDEQMETIIRTE
jgi:hypothetical protein